MPLKSHPFSSLGLTTLIGLVVLSAAFFYGLNPAHVSATVKNPNLKFFGYMSSYGPAPIDHSNIAVTSVDWVAAAKAEGLRTIVYGIDGLGGNWWKDPSYFDPSSPNYVYWTNYVAKLQPNINDVEAIFIVDEPGGYDWQTVMDKLEYTAVQIKAVFPNTPLYVNFNVHGIPNFNAKLPEHLDWVGFDCNGQWDSCGYDQGISVPDTLKMLKDNKWPYQKIILMPQAYNRIPPYFDLLTQPELIDLADKFFAMAQSDPDIIGVFPYQWWSNPYITGLGDMSQALKDKWADIGRTIINSPPTIDNVTIDCPATGCKTDGTRYQIVVTGSYPNGAGKMSYARALINFQDSNAGAYRGYLLWHFPTNSWTGYPDNQLCTGVGGYAALAPSGFGYGSNTYMGIDSCTASNSGDVTTVTFTVHFKPAFTTPITNNDISGQVENSDENYSSWTNFDINFSLEPTGPTGQGLFSGFTVQSIPKILTGLACYAVRFGMIASTIAVVASGIAFALSKGNPTGLASAKKFLLYSIVGGLVIYGVYTIILSISLLVIGSTSLPWVPFTCS